MCWRRKRYNMFKHSLTQRLTLYFLGSILLVISSVLWLVNDAVGKHFIEQDKQQLEDKISVLQSLYSNNKSSNLMNITSEVARHAGLTIQIKDQNKIIYGEALLDSTEQVRQLMKVFYWSDNSAKFLAMRFEMKANKPELPLLQATLSVNINHHLEFLTVFKEMLIKFTLVVGALSVLLCWFMTRQALLPLVKLTKKASLISKKDLSKRMPTHNLPIEIYSLSCTLNQMLDRLEVAMTALTHFSSDIAHELRTPVNNLMTETQVCLSYPREKEEYINTLASNIEEYERLSRMITDMLFLAKSDNQHLNINREQLSVEQEVNDIFEFYEALAEESSISLLLIGTATLSGDKLMLRRAFSNLLSNAIRYGYSNSEIIVQLNEQNGQVVATIENKGNTISADDIPHLFKRFYRADKSRTHSKHEGVGLGLAITKSIVELHNGKISVVSENNVTKFTLCFNTVL